MTLWAFWAAQEACFKVLQKVDSTLVFSPRHFEVEGSPENSPSSLLHFQKKKLFVSWTSGQGWVHCLATWSDTCFSDTSTSQVRIETFDSNLFTESVAVRILAKQLLEDLGWHDVEFRRVLREDSRPLWPQAYCGSALLPVDISFSHDGKFIAVAISR